MAADGRLRMEIENPPEDRVTIHLYGSSVRVVNEELLQQCFASLAQCESANACFERGLSVSCLETVAKHDRDAGCTAQAFGLASR